MYFQPNLDTFACAILAPFTKSCPDIGDTSFLRHSNRKVVRPDFDPFRTAVTRKIDNLRITNYAERFRFTTLQSRFQTFVDLWDRGLRAREEGRAGPFAPRSPAAPKGRPEARVLHVASFREPGSEMEKLHELYDRLADARRAVGEEAVPFHKFADLVKEQVKKIKEKGSPEVAFRVAVKDDKVNFTARGMKGPNEED